MKNRISIIIPAYNEAKRIGPTLQAYDRFFADTQRETGLEYELLVSLNGCTDTTVEEIFKVIYPSTLGPRRTSPSFDELERASLPQGEHTGSIGYEGSAIRILNLRGAGKGYAIAQGFGDALLRDNTLIGFVDADMATEPQYFYQLVTELGNYDGIIASRYMPGASVTPPRPLIKRWGSKIFYETLVRLLFHIQYDDYQCGAKLFTRRVIEKIAPELQVKQWAFDVELLYLCRLHGFTIKEVPTVWYDKAGSKLDMFGAGMKMLKSLIQLRLYYYNKGE
jgi:glycosyltransferase involved in cell wall biosynthesis